MSCSSPERELLTFWVAGTLEPAEAELVSWHVETCADCRAEAVDSAALVDGLRTLHLTAGEVVEAAAADLASPHLLVCARCRDEVTLLRAMNASLVEKPHARRWQVAAAAAVFVVGAGLAWYGTRVRETTAAPAPLAPEATIATRIDPIEPLAVRVAENRALVFRRPGASSQSFLVAFNLAIEPYRAGRYRDAVGPLAALAGAFPNEPEPPLYEGVAQLLAGDADTAIAALDRAALLGKGTEWQPDAEYYGARARLAAGRGDGRSTMVRMCASPGPYQSRSCRAIDAAPPAR